MPSPLKSAEMTEKGVAAIDTPTEKFAAALDDDLAVPAALAEVHAARADGNRALEAGDHDRALARAGEIRAMTAILGCDPLDERWETRDETAAALAAVDVLVGAELQRRDEARQSRDWALANEIRDRLKNAGIDSSPKFRNEIDVGGNSAWLSVPVAVKCVIEERHESPP